MATKKSSQTTARAKNARKSPARFAARTAKTTKSNKTTRAVKVPQKYEPYNPIFGIVILVISAIIFSFLLGLIVIDCSKKPGNSVSDASRFSSEYSSVEKKNVFRYISSKKAVELLGEGTGIVFLGYPSCPWCQAYAPMLDEFAKEHGVKTIYYYNTFDDAKNDTDDYRKIVDLLGENLQFDNVGNRHLYVPDVAFVVNGKIVANDWETSKDVLGAEHPEEYWTEERVSAWKEKMNNLYERFLEEKEVYESEE